MTNNDPRRNWGTGGEAGPEWRNQGPNPGDTGTFGANPAAPGAPAPGRDDSVPSRFGATGPYGSPGQGAPGASGPGGGFGGGPGSGGPGAGGPGPVGPGNGGPGNGPLAAPPGGGDEGGPRRVRGIGALGIAALMLGSAAVGGATAALVSGNGSPAATESDNSGVTNALEQPGAPRSGPAPDGSVESAAQKVLPSVVSIQVEQDRGVGSGSGSILSSDGLVLTNRHVVAAAEEPGARMRVQLNDGTTHEAEFVASHAPSDIAVIRIKGVRDLRPISLGDSSSVAVGQEVVAVGSPLGLASTVTSGIVSAINRPVSVEGAGGEATVLDAIQTDAAINPGNSGGALVDRDGNLIGVPSVIASNSSDGQRAGNIGLGFAIPINQARRIAEELINDGSVRMPAINAQIDTRAPVQGALVGAVTPGGAADRAGLREGDLIVKVDDRRIDSGVALIAAIRSRAVGETVKLTVTDEDGTGERTVDVTLEAAQE